MLFVELMQKENGGILMASVDEELLFTTVKLEGITASREMPVGTGFFYTTKERVFIVTNKHVIKDTTSGVFKMLARKNGDINGQPHLGNGVDISFNESVFVGHPDADTDVAVADITGALEDLRAKGRPVYYKSINDALIPSEQDIKKYISPLQNIVFIGYPDGIWDTTNFLPIIRSGITATPCYIDFKGRKEFVIDASVFPGSSGSPVFIYYPGSYYDKLGNLYEGTRLFYIGILSRGFQRNEKGMLSEENIPTSSEKVPYVKQMIGLGIVIKAVAVQETIQHYFDRNKM